jgi:hypothetical protein
MDWRSFRQSAGTSSPPISLPREESHGPLQELALLRARCRRSSCAARRAPQSSDRRCARRDRADLGLTEIRSDSLLTPSSPATSRTERPLTLTKLTASPRNSGGYGRYYLCGMTLLLHHEARLRPSALGCPEKRGKLRQWASAPLEKLHRCRRPRPTSRSAKPCPDS